MRLVVRLWLLNSMMLSLIPMLWFDFSFLLSSPPFNNSVQALLAWVSIGFLKCILLMDANDFCFYSRIHAFFRLPDVNTIENLTSTFHFSALDGFGSQLCIKFTLHYIAFTSALHCKRMLFFLCKPQIINWSLITPIERNHFRLNEQQFSLFTQIFHLVFYKRNLPA